MAGRSAGSGKSMKRVVVVGTSCSGKTTIARRLSCALGVRHIELDAIHWKPDWEARPTEEFRRLVGEAAQGETWVVDGNYSAVRDIVWSRATTLVWLNYSFRVVFWRALRRTALRVAHQEQLFSGNRETFRHSFLSRESIILWVITTYRRRQRDYRLLLGARVFPNLETIELKHPGEADEFLAHLSRTINDQAEG